MQINKAGIASLLAGIIVLGATWYFAFYNGNVASSIAALVFSGLVVGGLAWLGLILAVLGILIMLI